MSVYIICIKYRYKSNMSLLQDYCSVWPIPDFHLLTTKLQTIHTV